MDLKENHKINLKNSKLSNGIAIRKLWFSVKKW